MIKCLFFAQLAEYAQQDSVEVVYQDDMTPRKLLNNLESTQPKQLIDSLLHDAVMVSVNHALVDWDEPLSDGDEVAFLPPFSGG